MTRTGFTHILKIKSWPWLLPLDRPPVHWWLSVGERRGEGRLSLLYHGSGLFCKSDLSRETCVNISISKYVKYINKFLRMFVERKIISLFLCLSLNKPQPKKAYKKLNILFWNIATIWIFLSYCEDDINFPNYMYCVS